MLYVKKRLFFHLDFSSQIYFLYNIKKLQSVQNFAARIISGTRKFDHITPVLNQLQWLPVKHQIRFRDNLLVFKCLNMQTNSWLLMRKILF